MPPPRYKHNCDKCEYLGQYSEFDMYACINRRIKYVNEYVFRWGETDKQVAVYLPDVLKKAAVDENEAALAMLEAFEKFTKKEI